MGWVTVIVKTDGSVTVRPDNPAESDASYRRAHDGSVWEHRTQVPDSTHDGVHEAIAAHILVLTEALESAPL